MDRIAVVDPRTHVRRVAPVKDTTLENDFYTFVNTDGELDGKLEQLLCRLLKETEAILRFVAAELGTGTYVNLMASTTSQARSASTASTPRSPAASTARSTSRPSRSPVSSASASTPAASGKDAA